MADLYSFQFSIIQTCVLNFFYYLFDFGLYPCRAFVLSGDDCGWGERHCEIQEGIILTKVFCLC